MNTQVELSIVIPMYNHAKYIEATLISIINQGINLEIIITDDMSTDNGCEIVENFAKNSPIPITLLKNDTKLYALHSRLKGVKVATADNILFMDADDEWLGTERLKRAFELKKEHNVEILHFCSRHFIEVKTDDRGEAIWARPFSFTPLYGQDVFAGFVSRDYFPIMLWDKIISKSLILSILPIVENVKILRFDDKFFVSLLMLHAQSYLGCKEYIYDYKYPNTWIMEKYAGRLHDSFCIWNTVKPLMQKKNIPLDLQEKYRAFIQWRAAYNMGHMSIKAMAKLKTDDKKEVFDTLYSFLDKDTFLKALLLSVKKNLNILHKKLAIIEDYKDVQKEKEESLEYYKNILKNYRYGNEITKDVIQAVNKLVSHVNINCEPTEINLYNIKDLDLLKDFMPQEDLLLVFMAVNNQIIPSLRAFLQEK